MEQGTLDATTAINAAATIIEGMESRFPEQVIAAAVVAAVGPIIRVQLAEHIAKRLKRECLDYGTAEPGWAIAEWIEREYVA